MELLAKVFQLSRDVKGFESLDYFVFYFSPSILKEKICKFFIPTLSTIPSLI